MRALWNPLLGSLILLWGSFSHGAPLCSVVLLHTSPLTEGYADLRHSGALDFNYRIDSKNLFMNRAVFPSSAPPPATNKVPLSQIHFMQNGISANFSKNRGSVLDMARKLRDEEVSVQDLPPIRVWQDQEGKIWTLDHRRLAAMILSGKVEAAPVIWASPAEILKDSFKLKNLDAGDRMLIHVNRGLSLMVSRPVPYFQHLENRADSLKNLQLADAITLSQARSIQKVLKGLAVKDFVLTKNLPRFETNDSAPPIQNTKPDRTHSLSDQVSSGDLLFSKSQLQAHEGPSAVALARLIQKNGSAAIPPLFVWKDTHQRLWTSDNFILAAIRLANFEGPVTIKTNSAPDLFADSQTGGQSILMEILQTPISIVID